MIGVSGELLVESGEWRVESFFDQDLDQDLLLSTIHLTLNTEHWTPLAPLSPSSGPIREIRGFSRLRATP